MGESCLRRQFPQSSRGRLFPRAKWLGQPNVCQRIECTRLLGRRGSRVVCFILLPRPAHLRQGTCLNAIRNVGAFVPRMCAQPSVHIGAHVGRGCPIVGAGLRKCCCVAVPPKPHMVKCLQASKQAHVWLRLHRQKHMCNCM